MTKRTPLLILVLSIATLNSFKIKAQTATWTPLISGTSVSLIGVAAISDDTCYVSGASGTILKTVNGGATWVAQTSTTSQMLYGLDFYNSTNGFAAGDNGALVKTTNGGATWTSVSITSESLRSVKFLNSSTGFITGDNGLILKTTNGGVTWAATSTSTSQAIYSVWFTSATSGYAGCFNGSILQTIDGGDNWTPNTTGVSTQINTIDFTSPTTGVFIGASGVVRRSTNSGGTWSTVIMTSTPDFLNDLIFVNSNYGFITGGSISGSTGIILSTTDGGLNWATYLPGTPRLTNVDFPNQNTGYAAGLGGTILKCATNVGILENENTNVEILSAYPNPLTSSTTIDISKFKINGDISFELFDISGKLVEKTESVQHDKIIIEKKSLSAGTYFFKVTDSKKLIGTGKIIIE